MRRKFRNTYCRYGEGIYVLYLPFTDKLSDLGNSFEGARSMLLKMERKFKSNQELEVLYRDFMKKYIELGHIIYLPHHGLFKQLEKSQN